MVYLRASTLSIMCIDWDGPCIFYGMVSNSAMILLLSSGNKLLTMEFPTCQLYFLGQDAHHSPKCLCVLTKKIQVTCGIFHGIRLESIA